MLRMGLAIAVALLVFIPQRLALAQIDPDEAGRKSFSFVSQQLFSMVPVEGEPQQNPTFSQFASMVGREDLVKRYAMQRDDTCGATFLNPISRFLEIAKTKSVVIINEDHGLPQHRELIGQLLTALRPLGYKYYAAETFLDLPQLNDQPLYLHHGFYSREPVFGRVVQRAKALGYRLVAYEASQEQLGSDDLSPKEQIERRESAQAKNIQQKIFATDPKAKIIVHVGGAHVMETPDQQGNRWMAARLEELTGVDALTISQVACWSGNGEVVGAEGKATKDGFVAAAQDHVDFFVGHPRPQYTSNRPAWRRASGDVEVSVPAELLSATSSIIVEARQPQEGLGIVPTDRILIRPNERIPLLLPPGKYRVISYAADGQIKGPVEVEVPSSGSK